jgi:hypothetical protein
MKSAAKSLKKLCVQVNGTEQFIDPQDVKFFDRNTGKLILVEGGDSIVVDPEFRNALFIAISLSIVDFAE